MEVVTVDMSKIALMDRKTANQLIPDQAQARLLWLGEQDSRNHWELGDLAVELVDEARGKVPAPLMDAAMGVFAGVGAERMADIRSVSTFYPVNTCAECYSRIELDTHFCPSCMRKVETVRERFTLCSFSHFRAARSAKNIVLACGWLDKCIQSMDDYGGMIMPVDRLRALMSAAGQNDDRPMYLKRLRSIYHHLLKVYQDSGEVPDKVIEKVGQVIVSLDELRELPDVDDAFD